MEVRKITVFIGNQGSRKSTIAKLLATLIWIEKSIVKGRVRIMEDKITANWFRKQCAYQNIDNYFKDNTIISYEGESCSILYENAILKIESHIDTKYKVPQIMYVPSERNFVSSVRNVNTLKGLPSTLYTFSDEFLNATDSLKGQIELPINHIKFEYQKLNKLAYIVGEDYKIKISESSSGFQSFVPLFIVTRYLALSVTEQASDATILNSIEEERRLKKEIQDILSNNKLTEELKKAALEILSTKSANSCFINIVEEPEQNLFPSSQRSILHNLLEYTNMTEGNKLLITTHSPYIINYLTLAVKAEVVKNNIMGNTNLHNKVNEIVPLTATINGNDLVIYELDENGEVTQLGNYNGLPLDKNYLNQSLGMTNQLFDSLLEIEEEL